MIDTVELRRLAGNLKLLYRSNRKSLPKEVMINNHRCGLQWVEDDPQEDSPYVIVGYMVPISGVYMEIEDGTYGVLQGFRIFLEKA